MPDSFSGMLNSILQRKRSQMDRGAEYGLPGDIALAINGASTYFLPYWDSTCSWKRWLVSQSVADLEAMRLATQTGTPPFDKIDRQKDLDSAIPIIAYWLKENSETIADGSIMATLTAQPRRPMEEDGQLTTPQRKQSAREFLAQILADGAVAVVEIERQARVCELLPADRDASQHKPFRRAKRALGIKSRKGNGFAEGWLWEIGADSGSLPRASRADRGAGRTGQPDQVHAADSDVEGRHAGDRTGTHPER